MGVATMTKVWLRPADGTARLVTICEYGVVRTHHSWLECLFWKPCWYRQVGLWRSQSVDRSFTSFDFLFALVICVLIWPALGMALWAVRLYAWWHAPPAQPYWEVVHNPDPYGQGDDMWRVRWSEADEEGRYLWVRHYPDEHRAERDADEFNRLNRQPWEFSHAK